MCNYYPDDETPSFIYPNNPHGNKKTTFNKTPIVVSDYDEDSYVAEANSQETNYSVPDSQTSNQMQPKDKEAIKSDSIHMLTVAISTVMLMAAKVPNIPNEYYVWTDKYLKCIKNKQGQYPPNVKRILRMLGVSQIESIVEEGKKCKCPYIPPQERLPKITEDTI